MADLIDAHVSVQQCKKAVDALHAHAQKRAQKQEATELLPGKEQNVWLNVTVKKIASAHRFKPVKIPIAHPIVDPRTSSICLITKDPQRQYKDLLEEHGVKFISRVVGIEKLKGKFKPFEARRMLLKENGLFLADERVVPLLPKLLGVKWFEAKKQPIPVCLTRKDLKGELERAISSTYMNQNQGTCTAIKISTLSHTPAQILDNLRLAIPAIMANIKGGWANVQSLLLKTNQSAGLPVWSCELGGRFDVADDEESGLEASGSDAEMEVDVPAKGKGKEGKGKKRAVPEVEELTPTRNKKAKGKDGKAVAPAPVPTSAPAPAPTPKATPAKKTAPADTPAKSDDAETPKTKSKKRKGVDAVRAEEVPLPASPAPAVAKKAKTTVPTTTAKVEGGKGKKKEKTKTAVEDAPAAVETDKGDKAKKTKGVTFGAAVESPAGKKEKKAKPDATAPSPAKSPAKPASDAPATTKKSKADKAEKSTPAPSLNADELKQKRAGKPGEGKKEKVVKGILKNGKDAGKSGGGKSVSGGKSAKDGVMGRKRA
ncbi:ribosomal protein L1p/L10e family-domain-containing protein [Mycena galopus ATCC 62051]|nr:ribosomal protein L1p/L10e family-domain-containing protein [Mycena galopus ATCC 62051]